LYYFPAILSLAPPQLPVLGVWGSIIYVFLNSYHARHGIAFSSLTGIAGGFINSNKPPCHIFGNKRRKISRNGPFKFVVDSQRRQKYSRFPRFFVALFQK
jgi:hypothetical protein